MPRQTVTLKIDSSEVQGEGSFIVVSSNIRWKQVRQLQKQSRDAETGETDNLELGMRTIAAMIVDWNWTGDDGEPLPAPAKDPSILDDLTQEEMTWLFTNVEEKLNLKLGN